MADVLNDELPAFMRHCASQRFAWGKLDCALMLADWLIVARKLSNDPAEGLRGNYHTAQECENLLTVIGWPWPVIVARVCRQLGLRRTSDPLTGDIAVLRFDSGVREVPVGAIRSGDGWFMMSQAGVVWTREPLRVMAAWRV